jgi:hypothetical protein
MSNYLVAIHIIELIAALAGIYYYWQTKDDKMKIFIWYLWFMVFVETFGMYGYLLQNNYDYDWFIWLKNSVWCTNTWLYNIFSYVSILVFGIFYRNILNDRSSKTIIKILLIIFSGFTILYFVFNRTFFDKSLPYIVFIETLMVFIFVMLYFKQLLSSDKVLLFYRLPVFYISVTLLLFYLCTAPLFTFDSYFYEINKSFIQFRQIYMFVVNIFLYSCLTFAFIYTIQFKKK